MTRIAILLLTLITLITAATAAPKTLLQLDTGGHMAKIEDIVFTPDGKQLVSASDDKTIRIWDLATGKTVRTIRGESAAGDPGKIYAMALSSDGKWLAVGGWMWNAGPGSGHHIRLYDFASGRLVALLKGHKDVVNGLAFSPDGRYLISGSGDYTAILWDIKHRRLKHRLRGHKNYIFAVGFTPDGARAVTGSFDHNLRFWRVADGSQLSTMRGHGDKVQSLAVAPDGTIASGDRSGEIRLWDGRTGALRKVQVRGRKIIGSLSFTSDSKLLLMSEAGARGPWEAVTYKITTGKPVTTYTAHDNIVLATAISPDGRWAATGGGANKEIHIWDLRTGKRRLGPDGRPLTLRGVGQTVWAVGFSPDGQRFGWGHKFREITHSDNGPLQHALNLPTAQSSPSGPEALSSTAAQAFMRAVTTHTAAEQRWSLNHRRGGQYSFASGTLDIKQNGQTIASITRGATSGNRHNAYSFTPDGRTVISGGSNGFLTAYTRQGKRLGGFVGHEGEVWGVAVSPDGRYLVSGSSDQTVRLWNIKTRELLVSLFYGKDGEWVMWTPEGFFMGSEGGGKLVGWQINQGADKAARYVSADQLRKIFYRPDLVAAKIQGDPDGKLREAAKRFDVQKILQSGPAPEVAFVTPGDNWETDDNKALVKVNIENIGGGVGQVLWKVNGQLRGKTKGKAGLNELELALGKTENIIEVVAFNKAGFVESKPVNLKIRVNKNLLKGKPDLYVLAVGVDDYYDSRLKLHYAVKDATRLVRVLEDASKTQAGRGFYRNVSVETLTNAQVSRKNMASAFKRLGQKMRPTDVFVFFIAGHGLTEQGEYYYLPAHFKYIGKNPIMKYGFGPKDWEKWTANIKAEKSLLVFDTCESGSAAKYLSRGTEQFTAYARLKDRTGRVIMMATNQKDVALEGYKNKHGVLTYAMLEAIALGDNNQDKQIMLTELIGYVSDRVPQMSCELTTKKGKPCYRQVPQANLTGAVFPIVPQYENAHPERISGTLQIGDAYPGQPTHVTVKPAELKDANGKTLRTLPLIYRLKPVGQKGSNTLVARDGKIIGYVPTKAIQPFQ